MVLGLDAVVVRTPFEDFVVKVRRSGSAINGEERRLADWAASQFRQGIELGDSGVATAARELLRRLEGGESAFSDGFGDAEGPAFGGASAGSLPELAFGGPVAHLENALFAGRLVVERTRISSLTEHHELEPPELPPLPPPPPEASTHTFEVRFVDEVGKAISGIDAEFTADGPQTRAANAAGIALLEGVVAASANVAVLDPDALAKVLDPRWEQFRPGKPPKESNTREVVFRGAELGPFDLKAEVPNTVVIKPPLGKLFVELWDHTGRVKHANRTYKITGPQAFEGTTDGNGRLLHEGVFPGDYQLSLGLDFFEEGDPDRTMDIVESALVTLEPNDGQPQVRLIAAVPRSVLAELKLFFNTNKAFLLPTALPSVRLLRRLYEENSPCKLLVVGHADTAAGPAYNDALSLERARATVAYLKDDVDEWYAFYGEGIAAPKRWGKVEDRLMISAMPNFAGKPRAEDPVHWYQRTRKLKVDGVAGQQTRQALIAEYMSLDGASLQDFVGEIDAIAHGCGENFPLEDDGKGLDAAPANGKRDPLDRRVELFFFDDEFGVTPPPPGSNSKPGSREYPLWRKRVVEKLVLRPEDNVGPKVQFVELLDAHFRTDSAVVLPEGEDPDQQGQHDAFSAAGFVATVLRVNEEQPGRGLLVAGHTDTAANDTHNDELSRLRAQVALSLVEGNRDTFKSLANQRHKPADINQILSWVSKAFRDLRFDCDPGKISDSVDSRVVRRFQEAFNVNKSSLGSAAADVAVDGVVGEETWGAFFDCYELELQRALGEDAAGLAALRAELRFADDTRKSLGFGEHFPIDELGVDNFRSQTNRRVEVLFFGPGEEPDLAQTEADVETSEVYLPGHYARESVPTRKTARVARVSFVPASFQNFRLGQAPFSIRTNAGVLVKGTTDAAGTVTAKLPADTSRFLLTVQDPAPLPEFQTLFEQQYQLGVLSPADTPHGAIQRLRMLGLWVGPELVVFSEGTTDALRYFQLLAGLPSTGSLDAATAAKLEQVAFEPIAGSS
ncbi:MAG: hypothetical protein EOO73_26550 [Myxococcales bacterium]|nr:MAG: hypothetical protein EOO73_26550 [Myxococcales bacterium]